MTTLHDSALEYATDRALTPAEYTALQRAFMAGALEALQRIDSGERRGDLLRQCLDYGRTVGTALETAR